MNRQHWAKMKPCGKSLVQRPTVHFRQDHTPQFLCSIIRPDHLFHPIQSCRGPILSLMCDRSTMPLSFSTLVSVSARLCLMAVLALSVPLQARTPETADANPEAATTASVKGLVRSQQWMAASANPLATEAGTWALKKGGSAVDAAIAMQLVLSLVEPQSSGLGGGAFMLTFDAASRTVKSYDGRETAPLAARDERFLMDGKPVAFKDAVNSGLSVGTPGLLRMLELAHRRHGRLRWADLFEPAIRLAEQGFTVSPRLHAQIAGNRDLYAQPAARAYFYPDGTAAPVGHVLKNTALAQVLRRVAAQGAQAFYEGEISSDIINAVRSHARPGDLSLEDLARYRAVERAPVCGSYRKLRLCGMGPPSSGSMAVFADAGHAGAASRG